MGVKVDLKKACALYELAVTYKNLDAMHRFADVLEEGRLGIAVDEDSANFLIKIVNRLESMNGIHAFIDSEQGGVSGNEYQGGSSSRSGLTIPQSPLSERFNLLVGTLNISPNAGSDISNQNKMNVNAGRYVGGFFRSIQAGDLRIQHVDECKDELGPGKALDMRQGCSLHKRG